MDVNATFPNGSLRPVGKLLTQGAQTVDYNPRQRNQYAARSRSEWDFRKKVSPRIKVWSIFNLFLTDSSDAFSFETELLNKVAPVIQTVCVQWRL